MLRRKTSTFLRLGDVDEENDLFSTDAGGEVVFPIKTLEPLAFFHPGDEERRLFVRLEVGDSEEFLGMVGKAGGGGGGFRGLRVVDQSMGDVRVGWHCGCFEEGGARLGWLVRERGLLLGMFWGRWRESMEVREREGVGV